MVFSKEISEAPTYKFANTARELIKQGKKILSFGLGEPDFKTPDYIFNATIEAMKNGFTHYSESQGLLELRSLISERVNKENSSDYDASNVIVTPGVKAALYLALASIVEPYDEIINITPYYVSYLPLIKISEPTVIVKDVALNKSDFTLDIEKIKAAVTPKTKAILINSPHSPTGMIILKSQMDELADIAVKNNIYIIADEIYDKFVLKGYTSTSLAAYPQLKDLAIIANGFSKTYAMAGWRLGYALAPKDIIFKMNKLQLHINTNTCTFIQKGACAAFSCEPVHLDEYLIKLEQRVEVFDNFIKNSGILKGTKPKGGFCYFVDISGCRMKSNDFCSELIMKTGIATTPGIAFGKDWDDYVKFSLNVDIKQIEEALTLLEKFIKDLKG